MCDTNLNVTLGTICFDPDPSDPGFPLHVRCHFRQLHHLRNRRPTSHLALDGMTGPDPVPHLPGPTQTVFTTLTRFSACPSDHLHHIYGLGFRFPWRRHISEGGIGPSRRQEVPARGSGNPGSRIS